MRPETIRNWTAFIDGFGYAGRVEEVKPPKLALKTDDYRAGGMDAPEEIDLGMEKLDAELTFLEYVPEVTRLFGKPNTAFTFRAAAQRNDDTTAIVIRMRGMMTELDPGSWKTGSKSTLKVKFALVTYQLERAGALLTDIDIENFRRVIGGTDQLAAMRTALGL